jgi:hypothetical protein
VIMDFVSDALASRRQETALRGRPAALLRWPQMVTEPIGGGGVDGDREEIR